MLTSGIHINREYVSESMYSLTLNKLNTLIFRSSEKEKLRSIKYPLNQTDRNLKFFLSISSSRELKIHLFPLKKNQSTYHLPIYPPFSNFTLYIYISSNECKFNPETVRRNNIWRNRSYVSSTSSRSIQPLCHLCENCNRFE